MRFIFLLSLAMLTLSTYADVAKNVAVDESFVRAAIQQQRNSAAFMDITNQGDQSALVSAKSPVARIVELHTHINDKGVMRMRKIKQINLPSHKMVHLKPGGLHVMLLGLNRDLKPGDQVDVTLGFADGSEKLVQVPVQTMRMRMKKNMKGHKMDGSLPNLMNH